MFQVNPTTSVQLVRSIQNDYYQFANNHRLASRSNDRFRISSVASTSIALMLLALLFLTTR